MSSHVEPKDNTGNVLEKMKEHKWIWWVILIVIVILIIWFVVKKKKCGEAIIRTTQIPSGREFKVTRT